jgi:outer membrane protein OmpA-like peptidoglycan-associated protein
MRRWTRAALGTALLAALAPGAACRSPAPSDGLGPRVDPVVLYFNEGSSAISERGYKDLRLFARQAGVFPAALVLVKGYSDGAGVDVMNEWLAHERAEAVARYLGSLGFDASRLVVRGVPLDASAAKGRKPRPQRTNRRVEVTLLP